MNKEQIFRRLHDQLVRRNEYIDKVPSDLDILGNYYVNNLLFENEWLIRQIFEDDTEAIFWFLYEWMPGYEVEYNGTSIKVESIDQYIDFLRKVEGRLL